jgi:hypothetical protein
VVPASFHSFFNGCASIAGALIGLLFVALSVSPEKLTGDDARAEHQVRAAAAFSALVNTLVISLVGLLPGASLGQVGIITSGAGLATTTALVIVLYREHQEKIRGDVRMLATLFVLYGLQLANAVQLDGTPRSVSAIDRQGGLAILFFLFAIARSWRLVGARSIGLAQTVSTAIQRAYSENRARGPDDAASSKEAQGKGTGHSGER